MSEKLTCLHCGANQVDYVGISIAPKGIPCAKCGKYNHFRIERNENQNDFHVVNCKQCNKFITMSNIEELDDVFCPGGVCLNSYVCEETAESKDEMLQALSYAENREDLEA